MTSLCLLLITVCANVATLAQTSQSNQEISVAMVVSSSAVSPTATKFYEITDKTELEPWRKASTFLTSTPRALWLKTENLWASKVCNR